MKPSTKKLSLSKSTIKNLGETAMLAAAGGSVIPGVDYRAGSQGCPTGIDATIRVTNCYTCYPCFKKMV